MPSLWKWPAISWLLLGLPCGAIGGWLFRAHSELADGIATLAGVVIGALAWMGLMALTYLAEDPR